MWKSAPCLIVNILLLMVSGISDLGAQTRPRRHIRDSDTTLATIATNFRTRGGDFYARDILTQRLGPESREKMDALADSLAAIAVEYEPGDGVENLRIASATLFHLTSAGVTRDGIPYAGAFERLVKVFEGSADAGLRASALRGIARLPDQSQSLVYLRKVATSTDLNLTDAYMAVEYLAKEMEPAGLAVLEELWREDLVQDRLAYQLLGGIAQQKGWQ